MFKKSIPILAIVFTLAGSQLTMRLSIAEAADPAQSREKKSVNKNGSAKKKAVKKKNLAVSIALGKKIYKQYQCFDCHSIAGEGCQNGMKLDSLGSKRTRTFIREQIVDPDKHFEKHPKAFDTDLNLMPPQNLESYEIDSLVEYLHSLK